MKEKKRFEELIVMYGTIIVYAKNKKQAKEKIANKIMEIKDKQIMKKQQNEEIIIGDIERQFDIKQMEK